MPESNPIRETLFGDMPLDQWSRDGVSTVQFPWSNFAAARSHILEGNQRAAIALWREVLQRPELGSRQHLQAWHFLRQHGEQPPAVIARTVWGVVAELPMPQGFDLVAAYADHSARYWNFSGGGVVWDHPDSSLDTVIDQLFEAATPIAAKISPSDKPRPAPPPPDQVRLSILSPSGIHFGQGPVAVLSRDPQGARVLQSVVLLMRALMTKAQYRHA
jgi:hypothetical protein